MQPLSTHLLEELVLSKPYFDRKGLIVAERNGRPVGFVHAGFGPNEDFTDVSREVGVTCALCVHPESDSPDLRSDLVISAEAYLRSSGASTLFGGAFPPQIPFYHGLYGGAEMPGVLETDRPLTDTFLAAGYQPGPRFCLLNCRLSELRVPVDRNQRQLNREFEVLAQLDHEYHNWWDACTQGHTERSCFQISSKRDQTRFGSVIWWDLEPLATSWGVTAVGMSKLEIDEAHRRKGLATFLVARALKQLKASGVALAQVQVADENEGAKQLFEKLAFEIVDHGVVYQKPMPV